jgi:hypothetical protein
VARLDPRGTRIGSGQAGGVRENRWVAVEILLDNRPKVLEHVVDVVRVSLTSAPRKYHAPLAVMVTCGQSWTIKIRKLAAST